MHRLHSFSPIILLAIWLLAACNNNSLGVPPESSTTITNYLVERLGVASIGGRVFCSYEPLADMHQAGDQLEVYLWVLCQEYTLKDNNLEAGSGVSLPVVLTLEPNNGSYRVVAEIIHEVVGPTEDEIHVIFPAPAWSKILPRSEQEITAFNAHIEKLEKLVQEQALAGLKPRDG